MSKLKNIIYLTQSDYTTLSNGGTVTKNGHTLTGIDEDSIYITTDQASIEDLTGILPVAHGGTGKNTLLSGQVLIGNGTSAITSKAIASTITNDSNTLPSTAAVYNSALLKSGGTMTGVLTVLGNQYADGYNGALNMNNSDIYGLNSIYTTDSADNAGEGIHFYRDSTHVDTLWINGGDILFVPNRALGTATTKANSEKVARLPASITASRAVYTDGTTGELAISSVTATELGYLDGVTSSIQTQLNNKAAANAKITIAGNDVSLGGNLSDSTLRESLGLSKALRFIGVTTTDMTGGTAANHSWTGTPAGISNYTPKQGDVVINSTKQDEWVCTSVSGTTYTWERLGSDTSYKIVQSAVADPTAATTTSTTFIDTISQNTNGVITATKKTLPTASSSVAGITKVGASGGAAEYSHTHSYLANTNKGAENRPIYITGNTATECEYMFPIYYKALDFSSTAPIPGAYPVNSETNPATNTTGWFGSALSLPGINASTKHYAAQIFIGSQSGADKPVHMYVRRLASSPAWSSWSTVLDNENYNSYAPTLTGDGASGTWNINISGSAGSVAWTNVSGRPTNLDQFTNGPGYVTSSGVTKVSTGAGLTGGDITTTGTISINGMNTSSGATDKWLNQKGEWTTPPNDNTHHAAYLYAGANNATKHAAVSSGTNIYLCLRENGSQRSAVQIKQGSNMTISSDASGIITFAAKDTTYSNFVKSGVGAAAGLVPSPGTTAGSTKYLREDGTWAVPPDTKYTLTAATTSALGGIQLGYSENGKNYPVELSNNKAFVNVPWTDTNNAATHTLNTAAQYYVTGTTSASTSTGGDTFDTGIYATTTAGQLNATSYKVNEKVTLQWNSTDSSLDFIFT